MNVNKSQQMLGKNKIIKNSILPSSRILAIIDQYKPFIPVQYHYCFETLKSDEIPFIHYLIFAVWFCSQLGISINKIDFYSLYNSFKHLPFHSFLFHIQCRVNTNDDICTIEELNH